MEVILEATNYFSDENKLGQGGFGPVYKAMILFSFLLDIFSANCENLLVICSCESVSRVTFREGKKLQ